MSVLTVRVAVAASALVVGVAAAAPASAAENWGINGTFKASSNGEWAKINYRFEPQPSTLSTWTISTNCTSPMDCVGTVASDAGWTAPIYTTNGFWYIKRAVPSWRYCEDGSPIDGQQIFKFYPLGPGGLRGPDVSDEYTGQDKTIGASGVCGRNKEPLVEMPFYMQRI